MNISEIKIKIFQQIDSLENNRLFELYGVINNFLNRIISQIALNPKQYPLFNSNLNIRRCVITKQNTLFYRIEDINIEIVRIYDTRQNPKTLKIKV